MTDVLSRELPAPKRWQDLESLAFDVYRRLWQTTDAELHGRTGQPQAGVDVYGTNRVERLFTGVQCKGKDGDYGAALTEKELRAEVSKALTFQPPLEAYVVVTTAPNDAAIQAAAREITTDHRKTGLFEVRVTGWDTLRHYIADDPQLLIKHFRDFAPADVLGQLAAGQHDQAQGFATIAKMIQSTNRLVADVRDDKAGTDELAGRITEISKLTGDGSPKAALRALDRLAESEGPTASPLARYRLLASKGNAHYALGQEAEAISLFRDAYAAHPELANARATLAIALLLEGEREQAFDVAASALADDPSSARTAGVVLDAAPEGTSIPELEAMLAPELLADVDIKLHLALRAHALGDHGLHRRLSEEALALAPDDWRTLSAVAEALTQPLSSMDGLALTHALPEESRADVERAVVLTRKAWARLAARDSSHQGRHVAANLVSLLGLTGREQEAEAVLDQALLSNAGYDPLAQRSAQRHAAKGDWKGVAATLARVPEAERSFDSLLLLTQTSLALGDETSAAAAIATLTTATADQPSMPERDQLLDALRVKTRILGGADRDAEIAEAVDAQPHSIVLRSILFDDLPADSPLRSRLLEEISELARRDLTLRERIHAAETLYEAGSHSTAADLYGPLHDRADSHALRRRIHALFLADRRLEARKLFETLSPDLRASPRYLNIGINIYERAGLLKPALKLLEHAIGADDTLQSRLAWMQILVRLGRRDRVLPWLKQVPVDIDGSADELMSLARIIDQYIGRDPRSLEIGYRALRDGYGSPRIHLAYAIGLVISGSPDDGLMSGAETIGPGSGVVLRNETTGETIYRIIETRPAPVIERGELAPDDAFAQRLLGLRVGDTFEVAKAGVPAQMHRVEEIQSRHLFAFRRTLRDFPSLFPENPAFGSFEIDDSKGDDRFEEMFALARRRAEDGKAMEAIYRDNVLPLPMMAKFTGAGLFDLWEGLSLDPSLGLKAALGIPGEFEAGRAAASGAVCVVDPVSVYAWSRLKLTGIMAKSRSRLAVVQATLDTLRHLVEEREGQRGRKMGTFGWDGENYQMIELTDDVVDQQVAHAAAALTFAETLLLVPAETDRIMPDSVTDLVADLPPAHRDTLLATMAAGRALLTDDLGFRVLAQEAGAAVAWTQTFAQAGHGPGGISHPEYRQVIGALMDANYQFTQFGHADVLGELQDSGWTISDRLRNLATLMRSAAIDRGSIAKLLAVLIVDSKGQAPDHHAFAAFHVEYVRGMRGAGRIEEAERDYDATMQTVFFMLVERINRIVLRGLLLGSTQLTPPSELARDTRRIANRQVQHLWKALQTGGLTFTAE